MTLQPQEIPFDHPDSVYMFQPTPEKPFVATPGAIETFTHDVIVACWLVLRSLADEHEGIDYLQVFTRENDQQRIWFMEDGDGGAITALRPEDY